MFKTSYSTFGIGPYMVIQILSSPGIDLEDVGNVVRWLFLTMPHYNFASAITDAYTNYIYEKSFNLHIDTCVTFNKMLTRSKCIEIICKNKDPKDKDLAKCCGL